jgi:hypothetical protein
MLTVLVVHCVTLVQCFNSLLYVRDVLQNIDIYLDSEVKFYFQVFVIVRT